MTRHPRTLPPVTCPRRRCGSLRSRVYKTEVKLTTVERHRQCQACGCEWVTEMPKALESFLRMKAPLRKRAA